MNRHLKTGLLALTSLMCGATVSAQSESADKVIDFGTSTADSYKTYSTDISIPEGKVYDVITSRYSYWTSKLTGRGRLNIWSGGERAYLGTAKGASFPDWTGFYGDVHVYPYKKLTSNAGFYGIVWAHGGKTFTPDNAEECINQGKLNTCFTNCSLTLHDGTALATESGTRAIRIGHLEMEAGSRLYSYIKGNSDSPKSYYVVGKSNRDATLAGRISPMDDRLKMCVGIVKEGTGTYRITGNTNNITGAVRVFGGKVFFNNDAAKAKSSSLTGATGMPATASETGVFVMQNASVGGTGSIGCVTDVYGNIEPGDNGVGTLTIQDFAKKNSLTLRVRPTTDIKMDIASAESYDKVVVAGSVEYYNICQDFSSSTKMPKISINLSDDASLSVGDRFTLLTATGKKSLNDVDWSWDVVYPDRYTWSVEEVVGNNSVSFVATVTSLDAGNQNGNGDDDDDDTVIEEDTWNYQLEKSYSMATSLSTFSIPLKKKLGVAVRGWTMDLTNDNDTQVSLIANQFNAVVAENEMKFDATEPSKGNFNYGDGDKLVSFAQRKKMYVRGHCLVWHSQLPEWVSSDGLKNSEGWTRQALLDVMKNHIRKLVGRWKGKVHEWDVCNEILDDNQSDIRSNPNAYSLRSSVWYKAIGEDYVDSAFVWAHEADPDALLFLNDYDVEFQGVAKTEALYNLVKRLLKSGIPIHGVGLQCHLDAGNVNITKLKANMKRYEDLGLKCNITELDLGIGDTSQESLQKQADDYYAITRAFISADNCTSMMIWGLKDSESWRSSNPLLFDSGLNRKPAYYGVRAALRKSYKEYQTAVESVPEEINADSSPWYDLTGRKVQNPVKGVYLYNGKKILR